MSGFLGIWIFGHWCIQTYTYFSHVIVFGPFETSIFIPAHSCILISPCLSVRLVFHLWTELCLFCIFHNTCYVQVCSSSYSWIFGHWCIQTCTYFSHVIVFGPFETSIFIPAHSCILISPCLSVRPVFHLWTESCLFCIFHNTCYVQVCSSSLSYLHVFLLKFRRCATHCFFN